MIRLIDLLIESKTPITIYRVEDNSGLGPFRQEVANKIKSSSKEDYTLYKKMYNRISKVHKAVIVNVPKGYVFGYESKKQLMKWFTTEDLQLLKKYNFAIQSYNNVVNYYFIMDRELIFKKPK